MPRFDSVLSFGHGPVVAPDDQPANDHGAGASDDDDAGFEFSFAPPLTGAERGDDACFAPADDLFAHGRILPAYPVPGRADGPPPSPESYCAWAPRSAPGSPARELPKSASTGEARRFRRLRDLLGGGRSHSDGKEKFLFLQPGGDPASRTGDDGNNRQQQQERKPSGAAGGSKQQGKKKKAAAEMDMAAAHKLFYGKPGALPGADRKQHSSYLPYRTGIVGFFAPAHALGRSHHPY
jgi:hypothetical protein